MKKLLAVLLALVMTMALTLPAFAADDGGPGFRTENWSPVPTYRQGDPIPFNMWPDGFEFVPEAVNDAAIGIIGGADGPTAVYITPELEDIFNGNFKQWTADGGQALIDAQKRALGGVPGQIGVMINGEYVRFASAAPESVDGRTMVPVRALVEALGGKVDVDGEKIKCTLGKTSAVFSIGSSEVAVENNPMCTGLTMDCAPYIKNGSTYVPVRFLSEALGCKVGWDSAFQTVILTSSTLAADIDKDFTILNRVQANRSLTLKEGQSLQTDAEYSLTATLFDTLNGDKTYQADLTGQTLANAGAINGTCSLTLSDDTVDALMEQLTRAAGAGMDEKIAAQVRGAITGLKGMEVILNAGGRLYARASVLDQLTGRKNVWADLDLGTDLSQLLALQLDASGLTIGSAAASMADVNSVLGWTAVTRTVDLMKTLWGDDKFITNKSGTSTRAIGLSDLAVLCGDMADVKDAFKTFSITMTVDQKGAATVNCLMETNPVDLVPAVKLTASAGQSTGKANATVNLHIANLCQLKLTASSTQKASADAPAQEPPADAALISAEDLLP